VLANYFLDGVSELFLDSAVLQRPAETSVVIITKNGPAVAISMKLPMLAPLRGAVSYTINRLICDGGRGATTQVVLAVLAVYFQISKQARFSVVIITFQPLQGFTKTLFSNVSGEKLKNKYFAYRMFLFFFVGLGLF